MGFDFKKKFGQNFIKDKNVIVNIASLIDSKPNDLIIEIGPGTGALTKELVKKEGKVLAYEIDKDTKTYLDKLDPDKLDVIYEDFLNRDITDDLSKYFYDKLYIVGNLPYYITTPIILKIINSNLNTTKMIFMIQEEVADRFSSQPHTREYGSITVLLNYYYKITKEFKVNRNLFEPIPNVDSAVISLTNKPREDVNLIKFNNLLHDAFQFKRKNLRNNLKSYDLIQLEEILKKEGFSLNNRAEDLPCSTYINIVKSYK